jgi:hypothetical protein
MHSDEDRTGLVGVPSLSSLESMPVASPGSATRATVVLVVEDPTARDRLVRHLTGRYERLVEAVTAVDALAVVEHGHVDALVFVRPSRGEALHKGLSSLNARSLKPRVLVVSSDVTLDALPGVDLRVALSQRASEVAQRVVDGLKQLGIGR